MATKKVEEVAAVAVTTEETKALTTAVDWDSITAVAERPDSFDATDQSGNDFTIDEIRLPRLAIAQGLSPQLLPGDGKYIKGLAIGEMFNDVTEEIYGTGPLRVVLVKRHTTRIEFDPNDKKVPLDRNVPAGDPRLQWRAKAGPNGEDLPPAATEFVEFICILLRSGHAPEPIIVSIKTTNKQQREAAINWRTYAHNRGGAAYTGLYKLSTMIARGQNKKGEATTYGHFVVKNEGYLQTDTPAGKALLNYAKDFYASLEGKTIETDRSGDDDTNFAGAAYDGGSTEM